MAKKNRFSRYVRSETIQIEDFKVTVRQIPHGEYLKAQQNMIGQLKLSENKAETKRQIESKTVDPVIFSDHVKMLSIESWTLKDDNGELAPIDLDTWYELPHDITEQIEKVIDRLNPQLEEDFRDGLGSNGTE